MYFFYDVALLREAKPVTLLFGLKYNCNKTTDTAL